MTQQQIVHLLYGLAGAGKSTYAKKTALEKNADRFAVNECLHSFFASDRTANMDGPWAIERVQRCQAGIFATGQQMSGLMREYDRDHAYSWADAAEHAPAFYWIDADRETRHQRVMQRNAEQGDAFAFEVSDEMFYAVEQRYERPTSRELARSITVNTGVQHE